ncbi:hypothetical protein [Bacillus inaquosorum]|uniref:hypothetical protein n=1 Tax=Bacillus inaquosorum TaxID=483913 RepID=UPI00227F8AB4|nr:hypothetical protein [Bacillus inaquosorum]MCY9397659.1 hypothetical protein [Bacillus inaquosorum]
MKKLLYLFIDFNLYFFVKIIRLLLSAFIMAICFTVPMAVYKLSENLWLTFFSLWGMLMLVILLYRKYMDFKRELEIKIYERNVKSELDQRRNLTDIDKVL